MPASMWTVDAPPPSAVLPPSPATDAAWRDHAFLTVENVDAEVHLEPGEALILAGLEALAIDLGVFRFGGVGIAADLVAELAAQHLIDGNAVDFTAKSQQAISIAQTPPAWRESAPNCLILRKILSMLHGFSPRMRLLRNRA